MISKCEEKLFDGEKRGGMFRATGRHEFHKFTRRNANRLTGRHELHELARRIQIAQWTDTNDFPGIRVNNQ